MGNNVCGGSHFKDTGPAFLAPNGWPSQHGAEGAAGGGFSIWPLQIGSESEQKRTYSV